MATKITKATACVSSESTAGKSPAEAEPPVKAETGEDTRRRRAGIACFL